MKKFLITNLILILGVCVGMAQNSIRKATAPKASIVAMKNGQEMPLENLKYGEEQIVKVTLKGGVQNINHKVFVTSTNAVVKKVSNNEYSITPTNTGKVDLIVDVETYEEYMCYLMKPKGKKKKLKKVLTTYPPEKYMVSYETFLVNK